MKLAVWKALISTPIELRNYPSASTIKLLKRTTKVATTMSFTIEEIQRSFLGECLPQNNNSVCILLNSLRESCRTLHYIDQICSCKIYLGIGSCACRAC